ncbi:hypothetical protein HK102_005159 [Quaeritorhiza haematococci]|nr:hypothetical protein HK102_005159 [Quaeritorhiza haematococci]
MHLLFYTHRNLYLSMFTLFMILYVFVGFENTVIFHVHSSYLSFVNGHTCPFHKYITHPPASFSVLYRRVKDIYLHILHEEEKQNLMVQLTGLRREVDTLKTSSGPVDGETIKGVNISAAGSGSGSGSAVGGTVKKVASGEQLRKREVGTKGD